MCWRDRPCSDFEEFCTHEYQSSVRKGGVSSKGDSEDHDQARDSIPKCPPPAGWGAASVSGVVGEALGDCPDWGQEQGPRPPGYSPAGFDSRCLLRGWSLSGHRNPPQFTPHSRLIDRETYPANGYCISRELPPLIWSDGTLEYIQNAEATWAFDGRPMRLVVCQHRPTSGADQPEPTGDMRGCENGCPYLIQKTPRVSPFHSMLVARSWHYYFIKAAIAPAKSLPPGVEGALNNRARRRGKRGGGSR